MMCFLGFKFDIRHIRILYMAQFFKPVFNYLRMLNNITSTEIKPKNVIDAYLKRGPLTDRLILLV